MDLGTARCRRKMEGAKRGSGSGVTVIMFPFTSASQSIQLSAYNQLSLGAVDCSQSLVTGWGHVL